jgi:hypothetical protein
MEHATPVVDYLSIKIADTDILLSTTCRASFKPPYNKIEVQIKPIATSLSYYEVRVTKADEVADIGVGKLAYWDANISANAVKTFSIEINSTNFSYGDTTYRLSFYAKSAIDGSWDVSYLYFTFDDIQFILSDESEFAVLTDREAPTDH